MTMIRPALAYQRIYTRDVDAVVAHYRALGLRLRMRHPSGRYAEFGDDGALLAVAHDDLIPPSCRDDPTKRPHEPDAVILWDLTPPAGPMRDPDGRRIGYASPLAPSADAQAPA